MPWESRIFSLAKDAEHPDENQDACRVDGAAGLAVIADGVATGIFSRRWAEILVEAVAAGPPDPADGGAFAAWLAQRRRAWSAGIDVAGLPWFQKPKMRQGAFSTLLWVALDRIGRQDEATTDEGPAFRLRARAIGDSCLFWVREDRLLETFPIQRSEEFDADPVVLGSLDLGRDHLLEFQSLDVQCRAGDLVVLCTDAVAQWAVKRQEQGDPPRWEQYWSMGQADWEAEVARLRGRQEMRYDDATLALLRAVQSVPAAASHGPPPLEQVAPEPFAVELDAPAAPPVEDGQVELDPQPQAAETMDWKAKLKTLSEEFVQQAGEQIARGLEQLKKARHSADEAIRKYREKLRSRDKKDK